MMDVEDAASSAGDIKRSDSNELQISSFVVYFNYILVRSSIEEEKSSIEILSSFYFYSIKDTRVRVDVDCFARRGKTRTRREEIFFPTCRYDGVWRAISSRKMIDRVKKQRWGKSESKRERKLRAWT